MIFSFSYFIGEKNIPEQFILTQNKVIFLGDTLGGQYFLYTGTSYFVNLILA